MGAVLSVFDNLTSSEFALLKEYEKSPAYEDRFPDYQFFDRVKLLAYARLHKACGKELPDNQKLIAAVTAMDWDNHIYMEKLFQNIYDANAAVEYPPLNYTPTERKAVRKAQFSEEGMEKVVEEEYFIRRYAPGYKQEDTEHSRHFTMNVRPDSQLFARLDDFARKYKCQYKFPHLADWQKRQDPIIIYSNDSRSEEQAAELKNIAADYLRKDIPERTNTMYGDKIADGLFMAREHNLQDIVKMGMKVKESMPSLAKALGITAKRNGGNIHPLSVGQFENYKKLIDSFVEAESLDFNYSVRMAVPQGLSKNRAREA